MNLIASGKNKLGFVAVDYKGRPVAQRLFKSGFKVAAYDVDRMIKIKRLGCVLVLIGVAS